MRSLRPAIIAIGAVLLTGAVANLACVDTAPEMQAAPPVAEHAHAAATAVRPAAPPVVEVVPTAAPGPRETHEPARETFEQVILERLLEADRRRLADTQAITQSLGEILATERQLLQAQRDALAILSAQQRSAAPKARPKATLGKTPERIPSAAPGPRPTYRKARARFVSGGDHDGWLTPTQARQAGLVSGTDVNGHWWVARDIEELETHIARIQVGETVRTVQSSTPVPPPPTAQSPLVAPPPTTYAAPPPTGIPYAGGGSCYSSSYSAGYSAPQAFIAPSYSGGVAYGGFQQEYSAPVAYGGGYEFGGAPGFSTYGYRQRNSLLSRLIGTRPAIEYSGTSYAGEPYGGGGGGFLGRLFGRNGSFGGFQRGIGSTICTNGNCFSLF